MSDLALSPEDTAILIDYARPKYAEERWPLSTELRLVREVIEKLRPKPAPVPAAPARPCEPSMAHAEEAAALGLPRAASAARFASASRRGASSVRAATESDVSN